MNTNHRSRIISACATITIAGTFLAAALPAAQATDANGFADLIEEYSEYWQPPQQPYDGTGSGGTALNAKVLQENDATTVAINHAGAANLDSDGLNNQVRRALSDRDADKDVAHAFKDGFGPILGEYFEEGYNSGQLELVKTVMEENGWSGNPAKEIYQYPRPFTERNVWLPDTDHLTSGNNNLLNLPATLDIHRFPDGIGSDGKKHSADYTKNAPEGSFPSGHTNKAYSRGVTLAAMIPQLAPEILARVSEMGNNRPLLGVHYALDVVAGRIGGHASNAAYWSAHPEEVTQAAQQLQDYLASRCQQDGHGSTLSECIVNVQADDNNGYTNDFTDPVSTKPVADRASAIDAYTARMTYNFSQVSASGQTFTAPEGAAELLRFAYPQLNTQQRNTVIELTAIDSGYPLDSSSNGWMRINLAKALSATVTLAPDGTVVSAVAANAPNVIEQTGQAEQQTTVPDRRSVPWGPIAAVAVSIAIVVLIAVIVIRQRSSAR